MDKRVVKNVLKVCLLREIDNNIAELCSNLKYGKRLPIRCQSALSLAVFCRSQLREDEIDYIFNALDIVWDGNSSYGLLFCQALLLCMLSKQNLTPEQFVILEGNVLKVALSIFSDNGGFILNELNATIMCLDGEQYTTAVKLCEELFPGENLDLKSFDLSTVCCSVFQNLSKGENVTIGANKFRDPTLKYILCIIGRNISLKEVYLENLAVPENGEEIISALSYTLNQCLQVLDNISSADPSFPCITINDDDRFLLRCLPKLLVWSRDSFFTQEETASHTFHYSTLILILRLFTILCNNPDQFALLTNFQFMEEIMLCVLKAYFYDKETHCDILALALKMMINYTHKSQRTFANLCLKMVHVNESIQVFPIEALLKLRDASLQEINKVKMRTTKKVSSQSEVQYNGSEDSSSSRSSCEGSSSEEDDVNLEGDIELYAIVSFTSILIAVFKETIEHFFNCVREGMSREKYADIVAVLKKFYNFSVMKEDGIQLTPVYVLLKAVIENMTDLSPDEPQSMNLSTHFTYIP